MSFEVPSDTEGCEVNFERLEDEKSEDSSSSSSSSNSMLREFLAEPPND